MRQPTALTEALARAFANHWPPTDHDASSEDEIYDVWEVNPDGSVEHVAEYRVDLDGNTAWRYDREDGDALRALRA